MFKSRFSIKNLFILCGLVICGGICFDYLLIKNVYGVTIIEKNTTAYLPRDLSKNEFELNFKINLGTESVTSDTIYENLKIYLSNSENYSGNPVPDESNLSDSIDFRKLKGEITVETQNEDNIATGTIIIRGSNSDSLSNLVKDGTTKIKITYPNAEDVTITAEKLPPTSDAPTLTNIKSGFRSIKIDWNVPTTLNHIGGKTSTPTTMNIFIIKNDKNEITIPAKQYNANGDTNTTCTLTMSNLAQDSLQNCTELCDQNGNIYFNTQNDSTDYQVKNVSVSKGSTSLGGEFLEVGVPYVIIAQYQPDGVKRSQCGKVIPYSNYSLSEFYEGTTSKEDDLSCFIATAAYGSPFTKELKILRWFRDTYLKSNTIGKKLVKLYYKYSPNIAKKIEKSPILAKITRTLLYIPVSICYLLFLLNPTSTSFIGLILLISLISLSLILIKRLRIKNIK